MGDLGAIGENSLAGEGPLLGGIAGVENSLLEGSLTGVAGVENSLALEGPGYQGDLAILAAGSSSGTITLTGTANVDSGAAGDSSASLTLTGIGWILAAAAGASTATVSFTGAPSVIVFHRASPMQPISLRQDYTGFGFWQRRVSARQMRVRRLTP